MANQTPIVITSVAHGLATGASITVSGIQGVPVANGSWTVTVTDVDHFSLDGSQGNFSTYTGGGSWTENPDAASALVVTTTADTDDGQCDEATGCSLREAIAAAAADAGAETVTFAIPTDDPGYDAASKEYRITLTDGLGVAGGKVSILGPVVDRVTIRQIPGEEISLRSADVTLANLTLENGYILGNAVAVTVSNSRFIGGPRVHKDESGIVMFGGTVNVVDTLFSGLNNEKGGGALTLLRSATGNVANTTFTGNVCCFGAMEANDSTLNVSNSTFVGNGDTTVTGTGGVLTAFDSVVALRNNILTNSPVSMCANVSSTITGTNNLIDDESCGNDPAFRVGAVTHVDAVPQTNGGPTETHALLAGSNAINAVPTGQCTFLSSGTNPLFTNGAVIGTDQRGVARPQRGACDIGAFEYVNSAPVATGDGYSTNESTPLTVPAPGVLGNDQDPDNDAIAAALVSGPSHGTLILDSDGSFSYDPADGYNGSDSFTYRADEGAGSTSAPVTVSITVNAVDDPPTIAVIGGGQCIGDNAGGITLLLTDPDTASASLTVSSSTSPLVSGVVFAGTGGTRTATVTTKGTGTATLTLTVSDGHSTATVTVGVRAGGNGNNTLTGTDGADILLGQNGDDIVIGNGGHDLICGGRGNDRLTGGLGADTFDGGQGTTTTTDFTHAQGDVKVGGGS